MHGPPVDVAKHVATTPPPKVEVAVDVDKRDEIVRLPAKNPLPLTSSAFDRVDVPMPTKPFDKTVNIDEVAKPAEVVVAISRRGVVDPK